jgi:hypothetical protein
MKRAVLVGSVATAAIVIAGALGASAMGGAPWLRDASPEQAAQFQAERFEHHAELLGISVDAVKDAWAKGISVRELAAENGISEESLRAKMQAERTQRMQEHMRTLVSQGVITQAQADQHLSVMGNREPGEGRGPGGSGMHRGRGMDFGL